MITWILVAILIINITIAYWMMMDSKKKKFDKSEQVIIFVFGFAFSIIGLAVWLSGIVKPSKKSSKLEKIAEKALEIIVIVFIVIVVGAYATVFLMQQTGNVADSCGNTYCSNDETCLSCPQDCGYCNVPG